MDEKASAKAAMLLETQWRDGEQFVQLPEALRPATRAGGYRVQAALERISGDAVAGWKIAATSAAGQAHINVDGPMAGRIFAGRLREPGDAIPLAGNNMRVAELEFAFRLGRDLPPREGGYSKADIHAAVDGLHPAIEIPASRYTDFTAVGAPSLIADNSCAHLFVFGPAFSPAEWRGRELRNWRVTAEVTGKGVSHGIGSNVLGDPWAALAWLVAECSAHGMMLSAGQLLSTGTCVVPVPVEMGDRLTADYGLGDPIELRFV